MSETSSNNSSTTNTTNEQKIPTWIFVCAIVGGLLLFNSGSSSLAGIFDKIPIPPILSSLFGSAPIKEPGFRVLFVNESSSPEFAKLPEAQKSILTSAIIREYTNRKCVKDEQGRPEFRLLDPDQETESLSQIWKDALARERKTLPWMIVSNGRTGYEGPLPANVEETLTLLKKYGGE